MLLHLETACSTLGALARTGKKKTDIELDAKTLAFKVTVDISTGSDHRRPFPDAPQRRPERSYPLESRRGAPNGAPVPRLRATPALGDTPLEIRLLPKVSCRVQGHRISLQAPKTVPVSGLSG
jgi:hypothetical protein